MKYVKQTKDDIALMTQQSYRQALVDTRIIINKMLLLSIETYDKQIESLIKNMETKRDDSDDWNLLILT